MHVTLILLCAVVLFIGVVVTVSVRRRNPTDKIVVGGLYASKDEAGVYRVVKVLATDDTTVHVRLYKNKFPSLPQDIDPAVLSLGKLGDPGGFGIGHAPIARDGWLRAQSFLKQEPVRDEELKGYRYYLDEMRQK